MLFNSIEFIVFLSIVYPLYRVLPFRGQNLILLIASYLFYGWWNPQFLFLILLITSVDFCSALIIGRGQLSDRQRRLPSLILISAAFLFATVQWKAIHFSLKPLLFSVEWSNLLPSNWTNWLVFFGTIGAVAIANLLYPKLIALPEQQRKKLCLTLSIILDLGILALFKYFNFFVDSVEGLLHSLGVQVNPVTLNLLLPVGISFYTFQTMSYTIDVYRQELEPANRFSDFALSVCFFPHLVAGPIVRAANLMPQFTKPRTITFDESMRGLYLILFGLFKKVAIADGLAGSVNAVYNTTGAVSWLDVVAATLLFTFQIYCDFSGYTDIARGVAKLFGVDLVINFDLPYFAKTPSEFWQRWHISLSTWLRDYLYISLGGNRKGKARTYQNLMATMVLGGLWHGAAWNYVLWGFYHGSLLCIYRILGIRDAKATPDQQPAFDLRKLLTSTAAIAIFFGLTCYGWLLFRANSLEQIVTFTKILLTDFGNFSLSMPKPTLSGLLGLIVLILYEFAEYQAKNVRFYSHYPAILRGAFYGVLTLLILIGTSNVQAQFIYFQF
jgi:alginate O-acetyltransferase complex protein AlgI